MTAQQLVEGALRLIGALASGESPTTEELNDALSALNQLIASWSAQALPIYQITRDQVTLTGAASYPLTGNARPVKIRSAAVITATGISKEVDLVDSKAWGNYLDKGATGNFANVAFYDAGYPTATLYLAPKPTAGTLELYNYKALGTFAALSDAVTLPPGYERALRTALAVELAPEYGRAVDGALAEALNDAKTSVFGLNQSIHGHPAGDVPTPGA